MPDTIARHETDNQRATFNEVLWQELKALRPEYCAKQEFEPSRFRTPQAAGTDPECETNLRELYRMIGTIDADTDVTKADPPLSALCLSGGGIRSATFNLGVLQALAQNRMLGRFDYLSSVSGGGYIASWLQAWIHHRKLENKPLGAVVEELSDRRADINPLRPEPQPIDHLRDFSNYLTPKLGLFSGDTWTAAAIVVRNLLLNWLVIVPLLAALVVIPQGLYLVVQSTISPQLGETLLRAALVMELFASISVYYHRRFVRQPGHSPGRYVAMCVVPIVAAGGLLSFAGLGYQALPVGEFWSSANRPILFFAILWCVVVPAIGWLSVELSYWAQHRRKARTDRERELLRNYRRAMLFEFPAVVLSGLVAALILAAMIQGWLFGLYDRPGLYVMLVLPALLALYLLARTLFVGLASLSEVVARDASPGLMNDADREWWARLSGGVLLIAIGWIVVTGLCLFAQHVLKVAGDAAGPMVAAAGGISGGLAAFLGSRDKTPSADNPSSPMQKIALMAAAPVFAVCVFLLISWATAMLGGWIVGSESIFVDPLTRQHDLAHTNFRWFWALPGLFLSVAFAMGGIVNVNRFSLHGLYRNRLVRAYLGASNGKRQPDPFTGFDPADNLRMHKLRPDSGAQRLLPIVNITLNMLRDGKLAWQQRKAESFSVTPYYCGNFHAGYRPSQCYGGQGGITLGTAITISGAAANPNMGYCSSPALAFVMSLFNVRLGAWLGNTNSKGDDTYWLPGPRQALWPMLGELFGFTTPDFKYVNLSDGGHFDNLGLYEVVLRRCRYIVVSDAGCDGEGKFGDLGNAIRKIRIDFGIPIRFEKEIEIFPNSESKKGFYCASARVDYDAVDKGTAPGRLFYIKPTLRGRGESPVPYDVYSYSKCVNSFPHESTADQWFSESQFESYRMLGFHSLQQIFKDTNPAGFPDFFARVSKYMSPVGPPRRSFRPESNHAASENI